LTFRRYVVFRVMLVPPMVFIIVSLIFLLLRILPGNPALAILGEEATPEAVKALEEMMGLNKPLYIQYIDMWRGILTGNLGRSLRVGSSVTEEILSRLPITLELILVSFVVGNLLAVLIGSVSAVKGGLVDSVSRVYSVLGYCIPVFWLGMILQTVFSVKLALLPVQGVLSPMIELKRVTGSVILDSIITRNFEALVDGLAHYTLPWLTLTIWYSSVNSRVLRADMIEVLSQPYITTAVAKGLPERRIILKHALRNAIIPMLTLMGLQFARALAGVVLTETVFNIPGMGRLLYESVLNRDYPMVQGLMIWFVGIIAAVSLAIDVLLAYVDPRIKF